MSVSLSVKWMFSVISERTSRKSCSCIRPETIACGYGPDVVYALLKDSTVVGSKRSDRKAVLMSPVMRLLLGELAAATVSALRFVPIPVSCKVSKLLVSSAQARCDSRNFGVEAATKNAACKSRRENPSCVS